MWYIHTELFISNVLVISRNYYCSSIWKTQRSKSKIIKRIQNQYHRTIQLHNTAQNMLHICSTCNLTTFTTSPCIILLVSFKHDGNGLYTLAIKLTRITKLFSMLNDSWMLEFSLMSQFYCRLTLKDLWVGPLCTSYVHVFVSVSRVCIRC